MSECVHGMTKGFCAECSPRAQRRRPGQHRPSPFTARYGGWCKHCGDRIEEGDEVGYVDDELACEQCVREAVR